MNPLRTSGYEKWYPLRLHVGRNPDGTKISAEVYRNMVTGEICHPKDKDGIANGWNGEPPPLEPWEKVASCSDKFRENYDQIRWDKK